MNTIKLATLDNKEGQDVTFGKYPGGEVYIKDDIYINGPVANVQVRIESSDDVMALLLTVNALKRMGIFDYNNSVLYVPYFPYARQDRATMEGVNQSLSAEVMADLINYLNFRSVVVSDPHSDVTPALIKRCQTIDQTDTMESFFQFLFNDRKQEPGDVVLVAPDAGAMKKIYKLAERYNIHQVIHAEKVRDMSTGQITGTKIHGEIDPGKHYVIVDDICDGGRTFIEIAKEIRRLDQLIREQIKDRNARLDKLNVIIPRTEIHLAVTHGIFSKGIAPIIDSGIDLIFAQNPWQTYIDNINLYECFRHENVGIFGNTQIFFQGQVHDAA